MKNCYIVEVKTHIRRLSASALSSQIVLLKPSTLLLLLLCWFISAKAQTTPCSTPAISGTLTACAGSGSTLSSTTSGGTWTSSNTSVATVVSGTGVVSAVAAGTATISYTLSGGCVGTTVYTVDPLPDAVTLIVPASLCGGEIFEYETSPVVYDGTFFTYHPNVYIDYPSLGQTEVFNDGTTIINATVYYARYNACGTHIDSANIEIKPIPTNIVGNTMMNVGEIDTITSVSPGGIWSSSNPSRATINSISGILTTLSPGLTTISYTQIGGCYKSLPVAIDDGYPNAVGKINTIIGNGTAGYSPDGTSAGSALVTCPNLVDIDSTGNIYYVEGRYIRKKSTDNIITTIAGNGSSRVDGNEFDSEFGITPATGIPLRDGIEAMTVDKRGNVYVYGLGGIERISSDGHLSLVAGYSHYYASGSTAGVLIDEPAISPSFRIHYVNGMCTDNNGDLYYTDYYMGSVNKITIATNRVNTVAGNGNGFFPTSYEYNHTYNNVPATVAFLNEPRDVAVGKDGSIYIAETSGRKVLKVDTSGIIHTIAGETLMYSSDYGNGGPAKLSRVSVTKITVDSTGNLYISNDSVIRRISNEGIITAFAGTGSTTYNGECKNADVANIAAIDIAVDKDGGLVIAEGVKNRIRKIQNLDLYSPIITGRFTLTLADTSQLAASLPTGTWSSSNTSVATVDGTGKVISVSVGTTTISYMLADTCISPIATTVIYVNTSPEDIITLSGVSSVCPGSSTTISASVAGGSWISSNTSIATVSSAGIVTGVTSGTCIITYTVSDSTGTDTATLLITVLSPAPATPIITGLGAVCAEFNIALSASPTGGTWSSSNATVANIGSTTGSVSALTAGTCTMSYSLSNTCGTAVATKVITVNPTPSSISSASGFFAVAVGSTVTLNSSPTGGTWSSSNGNAIVNPTTGVVTGVTVGTSMISYTNAFGCHRNVLLSITSPIDTTPSLKIYTIAGTGVIGFSGDGGLASAAQFNSPHGIHIDSSGNIYVNDHSNYAVRKINTSGIINTIVGNGTAGYSGDGGPATAAKVNQVFDVITDAVGNMYIGDGANHRIRKISAAGIITTIAGTGTAGYGGDGGPATSAVINRPGSIALDNAGNIYFAEIYGHRVRKINVSTGIISTIAGTGTVGYTGNGGAATAAKLSYPNFLHIDAANNLYITDNGNHAIRKISTSGIITTIAGTGVAGFSGDGGAATAAKLSYPGGIDIDASGNIFITDHVNNRIRKINTSGIISTYAAIGTAGFSGDCGPATAAKINVPTDIKLAPNGNLHIADNQNNRIRIITNSVVITGTLGICSGSTSTLSHSISGGIWSSSNTSVATVGSTSGMVTGVAAGTATISYVFGGGCSASVVVTVIPLPAALTGSATVCVSASTTLSSATVGGTWASSNTSVATVGTSGTVTGVAAGNATISYTVAGCSRTISITVNPTPSSISSASGFFAVAVGSTVTLNSSPTGGTWSSSNGNAIVNPTTGVVTGVTVGTSMISYTNAFGCYRNVLLSITSPVDTTPSLKIYTIAGTGIIGFSGDGGLASAAQFNSPHGIHIDSSGNIYVNDHSNYAVRKINTSGIINTIVGNGTAGYSGDGGPATAAKVNQVFDVITDAVGNMYIGDGANHRIRKISAAGIITTIAGTGTAGYGGDGGPATAAVINRPGSIALDNAGNIYFAEIYGHRVRKINVSTGIISTVAGTGIVGYTGNGGAATAAKLSYPNFLHIDAANNLYITDNGNHAIRKISTSGIITTIAGTGVAGFSGDGGAATAAKLNYPGGIDIDASGNVFITDHVNNRIRKINTSGIISTYAAIGTAGFSGDCGPATAAKINVPTDIKLAPNGNLHIADNQNNRIRIITNSVVITGTLGICSGSTSTLSHSVSGGTWSSSNTSVATVGSSSGIVTGVAAGTATISYVFSGGCSASVVVTVLAAPAVITGLSSICVGASTALSSATAGGIWASSNTSVATVGTSGILTGVAAGNATISYTLAGCSRTKSITVNVMPAIIIDATTICAGTTTTLSSTTGGGTWASSNTIVATIGTSGILTGIAAGTATISYVLSGGCNAYVVVTVNEISPIYPVGFPFCGLLAWYPFNGNTNNSFGSIPAGRITDATLTTDRFGNANSAYRFNGDDSRITIDSTFFNIGWDNYTISCWTNSEVLINTQNGNRSQFAFNTIPHNGLGLAYNWQLSGKYSMYANSNPAPVSWDIIHNARSQGNIAANSWRHLVMKKSSGNTYSFYLNGVHDTTYTSSVLASDYYCKFVMGNNDSSVGYEGFWGKLDDYGIWKCALTDPEIWQLYTMSSSSLSLCVGNTLALTNATSGGTWSSGNTTVATIGSASGIVTGVSAGTATISYVVGGCRSTATVTVNALPATITGTTNVYLGATTTLSSATTGGTWTSSNTSVATVVSGTGIVTGVATGTANITYTNTLGCYRSVLINVYPLSDSSSALKIYTIAGTGVAGYSGDGGLAINAKINKQSYLTKDQFGNIYFSDRYNRRVRKIATNGIITTVAGNGTSGSGGDGGPATAAQIAQVSGLTVDADGNLYISDYDDNKIRKVNTAGIITTFAGTGASSSTGDGGHATAASIKTPMGLSVDHSGNLLVIEQYGHRVRKITPGSNIISTIIGTGVIGYTGNGGPATAATISYPNTIFVDSADNIYLTDNGNHALRKINTAGVISTIAGNGLEGFLGDGGPATSARLDYPAGATMDAAGNIYIADYGNHRVRKINTSGIISTYVGTGVSGYNSDCIDPLTAKINFPLDVIMSNDGGMLISDESNNRIRKVHTSNNIPVLLSGTTELCNGSTSTLTSSHSGGIWTSSNAAVATVSTSGIVTGTGAGTAVISYSNSDTCGSAIGSIVVTVSGSIDMVTIVGSSELCIGSSTTLNSAITGGSWISGNIGIATVGSTGLVSGIASGTVTISYTVSNTCGTVTATKNVTVNSFPSSGTITGASSVADGSSITLSNTTTGGTWSSSDPDVATVGSTGVVTGVSSGTTTISYTVSNSCGTSVATKIVTVNAVLGSGITGTLTVCMGSTTSLSNGTSGGSWSSSNNAIATINSDGLVTGVSAGTSVISYTLSGTSVTANVTVNALPVAGTLGGASSICVGSTATITKTGTGGEWSSSAPATATVGTTGIVSGLNSGTTTISYSVTNGCGTVAATRVVTVTALPDAGTISGASSICRTTTTTLTSTVAGGTWSSNYAAGASVNTSTGLVTGLAAGSFTISYRMSSSCGTATATFPIVVLNAPSLGSISGTATVCASATTTLTNTTSGGTWSSTNTGVATIGVATSGVVTGVAAGTSTISYNVTNICGSATATRVVTVNALPVAAVITGTAILSAGTTTTLTATPAAGTWLSGSGAIASINASGVVTGVSAGIATISYNRSNTCGIATATVAVTVSAATTPITGTRVVCAGATTNLANATTGGTWSTADAAIATIGTTGVVTGVAAGTTTVTYAFSGGGTVTAVVTVNAAPAAYTGSGILCIGSQLNLGSIIPGCTWTSGTPSRASVVTATGVVTGVSLGTVNISYVSAGCRTITQLTVNAAVATTTGATSPCTGSSITLSNATSGGTWSSSNTARATIGETTGVLAAISGGTVTISYTVSAGCVRTTTVTVGTPTPIAGNPNVCLGQTSYMSSTGGTWSGSSNPAVASLASNGFVTGVSEGTAVITYRSTANTTCFVTQIMTVHPLPSVIVPVALCPTETATLTSSPAGGTWTSAFPLKASIDPASGLVTAIILNSSAANVVNITYTLPTTCSRSAVVTVNQVPAPIGGGVRNICIAGTTTLAISTSGGTWSSATPALATITAGGVVTGVSAGLATISYTNAVGCASTAQVTVNAIPGANSGTASLCRTATTTLSNAAGAGTWTSSNSSTASVGMSTGIVTGTNVGTANITYHRAAGCTSVTVVTVNSCARPGMTEGTDGDNSVFTVSPNPTTGAINLTTDVAGKVVIYTIDGKQLQQYEAKAGTTGISLPAGLTNGVYMLRFNGADGSSKMVRLVYQQ